MVSRRRVERQPAALDLLERTCAALARDGVSMVRTFLLCDARSGVRFDSAGTPLGLDEAVFPDLDALVAARAATASG